MPDVIRPTHLCLVRHGETEWNVSRRIQGQLNPDLTDLGRLQAQAVAEVLCQEPWDVLYTSDSIRARHTAEAIAVLTGLELHERADLRERYQGKLEGMLDSDAKLIYPNYDAPEVGRESLDALMERANGAFVDIVAHHPGQRILVVTHGGVIQQYLRYLHTLGIGPGAFNARNTSITRLEFTDTCHVICVNNYAHIEGLQVSSAPSGEELQTAN